MGGVFRWLVKKAKRKNKEDSMEIILEVDLLETQDVEMPEYDIDEIVIPEEVEADDIQGEN